MDNCKVCKEHYATQTILESRVATLTQENAVLRALAKKLHEKVKEAEDAIEGLMEYIEGPDTSDEPMEVN
jgi:cell division protein FtsB